MQANDHITQSTHSRHLLLPSRKSPTTNTSNPTKLILPEPTFTPADHSKKSHARKQPAGHIPRPRNAFILFRCDFVRQKKIPESVENDHRNISRIVGRIWREMSDTEKDPWVKLADEEKRNHFDLYPGYRFSRGTPSNGRKKTRRGDILQEDPKDVSSSSDDALSLALDRAASCPPGALHVPTVNVEFLNGYGSPLKTRDDLARRPSRVTLYQSTPYELATEPIDPEFVIDIADQIHLKDTDKESNAASSETKGIAMAEVKNWDLHDDYGLEGNFCGPRFVSMRYPIPGMDIAPEWDNVNSEPHLWAGWRHAHTPTSVSKPVTNDGQEYPSLGSQHFVDYTLLPTIPPLPRSSLPYPFEQYPPTQLSSSTRKTSSFFSPRTGTWKLPLPILSPANDNPVDPVTSFADLDSDHGVLRYPEHEISRNDHQFELYRPVDPFNRKQSKLANDMAVEVLQEFSRSWISDLSHLSKE